MLALPERRQQIIQLTVRVAMCLDAESRAFMADAQAGLIEGGLEHMKERRHELLAAREQELPEAIVIVDSDEDQLLEQAGAAMDALRLAGIVRELYEDVRDHHEPWEVARAILSQEAAVRQLMIDGVKARGEGKTAEYERCRAETLRHVVAARPSWAARVPALKEACWRVTGKKEQDVVFGVLAVDDVRARLVLSLNPREAAEYITSVLQKIELLRDLEAKGS